jgi:hypothetical protein
MSPEQVSAKPESLDTRTDVYSLGVILFESLAGRLPHDVSSRSIPDAARIIRDEPPARLSTFVPGIDADIETICDKALEKDVARRYQSPADLAADIRRSLRGEAISAKRDSTLYIVGKFVKRHRTLMLASVLVLAALVSLGIYASIKAVANQQLASTLRTELSASHIERGRLLGATGRVSIGEKSLWSEYLAAPTSQSARWALWELYSSWPCVRTFPEDSGTIFDLQVSFDGERVAAANFGSQGTVAVFDKALARVLWRVSPTDDLVSKVAFSDDSRMLASAGFGRIMRIWDVANGQHIASIDTGLLCPEPAQPIWMMVRTVRHEERAEA